MPHVALPAASRGAAGIAGVSPRCRLGRCAIARRAATAATNRTSSNTYGYDRPLRRGSCRSAGRLFEARAAAAAEFHETSTTDSYYKDPSPLLALNLKKARKMAKRIAKQKKALYETAEMFPMAPGVVDNMVSELDKALGELNSRIEQLKEEELEKDSSSSSSDDDVRRDMPADTDAAVVLERMRLERAAASSSPSGSGMAVCAMSVEDGPPSTPGRVFVCTGKACMKRGAGAVLDTVNGNRAVQTAAVKVVACGCLGKCKQGAAIRVKAGADRPELITRIDSEQVDEFMQLKFD